MVIYLSKWISKDQYKKELSQFQCKSIYHSLEWLSSIANGFSTNIKFAITYGPNNKAVALTPFIHKKIGPFNLIGSPLRGMYTEFIGPLFQKKLNSKEKTHIILSLHKLIEKKNSYIEWGLNNKEILEHDLKIFGYDVFKRPTLIIELTEDEDFIWRSFEGRARNMIRKAEKAGLNVSIVEPDQKWIEEYYEMLCLTFERQGLSAPHPISFYKEVESLCLSKILCCMSVKLKNEMIAASIFLKDKKRMVYFSGVSNQLGMKMAANSLLQWHGIKTGIQLGMNEYDMGGLGVKSIDKFKRSFGGLDYTYDRLVYRSLLFKFLEPAATWAKRKGWIKIR